MAERILKDVKVNEVRIIFGIVNGKHLLCVPDFNISGYFYPFTDEFQQDNTQKLSELFKTKGLRNIVFAYLCIHTVNEIMKGEEDG